jgi:hypothetical protein
VSSAKTNYRINDVDQPEHGFPAYAAGKLTVNSNNSGEDIYAGDDLEWDFPPNPLTPGYRGEKIPNIVPGNRPGIPLTKNVFIIKRCDYTGKKILFFILAGGFKKKLMFFFLDRLQDFSGWISCQTFLLQR